MDELKKSLILSAQFQSLPSKELLESRDMCEILFQNTKIDFKQQRDLYEVMMMKEKIKWGKTFANKTFFENLCELIDFNHYSEIHAARHPKTKMEDMLGILYTCKLKKNYRLFMEKLDKSFFYLAECDDFINAARCILFFFYDRHLSHWQRPISSLEKNAENVWAVHVSFDSYSLLFSIEWIEKNHSWIKLLRKQKRPDQDLNIFITFYYCPNMEEHYCGDSCLDRQFRRFMQTHKELYGIIESYQSKQK